MTKLSAFGVPTRQEVDALAAIQREAFLMPPDGEKTFTENIGLENVRVIRRDGAVAGGLAILPMGQWFGGRSVPMEGIAEVVTAPESRGAGVATELMNAVVNNMYDRGIALSALWPASWTLYRRSGYEVAGVRHRLVIPAKNVPVRDKSLNVRPARPEDESQIHDVYRRWCVDRPGCIDRSPFMWELIHNYPGLNIHCFVACREDLIEGYVYYFNDAKTGDVGLTDGVWLTADATSSLMAFLGRFGSSRNNIKIRCLISDPAIMQFAEPAFTIPETNVWMFRLPHVINALEQRGYPSHVTEEVHFDIVDDVIRGNNGPIVLRVADGLGHVEKGGRGTFKIDVRGLASLFTGHQTGQGVVMLRKGMATREEIVSVDRIFSAPPPIMIDVF